MSNAPFFQFLSPSVLRQSVAIAANGAAGCAAAAAGAAIGASANCTAAPLPVLRAASQ